MHENENNCDENENENENKDNETKNENLTFPSSTGWQDTKITKFATDT